jgi:4-hydroxy-4-methyl-2-oxoglutarate aldolase
MVPAVDKDVVYRRIRRPDPALVARAARCPVSDLYEALPAEMRDAVLMAAAMRPLNRGLRIAGPAVTARCAPGDNLMMHKALLLAEKGDVLVVAASDRPAAQWGTLAALYAAKKGLAGVVVDGCIRDAGDLIARRDTVWSTAISAAHPTKRGPGSVNVEVVCAGVRVCPGDVVCADTDGVLVIPPALLEAAVAKAEVRAADEAKAAAAIEAGRTLFELHDLAAPFAASGIEERDFPPE